MPHGWSIHLTVGKGPPARVVRSAVVVDAPGALRLRAVDFSLSMFELLLSVWIQI